MDKTIKALIIGRVDKLEEIKKIIDSGKTNDEALIQLGIIENDDLDVFILAEDDKGNYVFEELKKYKEREASRNN